MRTQKRPTQWTTQGYSPQTPTAVLAGAIQQLTLLDSSVSSSSGLPTLARFTIMRIRGQMGLQATAVGAAIVSMGIAVVGTGSTPQALDPSAATDADYSWLWLRHVSLQPVGNATFVYNNDAQQPHGSEVDIRVKRKMQPNEALIFFIKASANMSFYPSLRTLVAHAI